MMDAQKMLVRRSGVRKSLKLRIQSDDNMLRAQKSIISCYDMCADQLVYG